MITVRPAATADSPWILVQLRAFDQFFGSSRSLFPDDETANVALAALIAGHPFFVAVDANGPVGFIVGVIGPHMLNPTITVLSELFWWVAEEARGSRAGALLLHEFMAFGKANADWIIMTLESDSPVHPNTLERRGFRLKERNFLLEVSR